MPVITLSEELKLIFMEEGNNFFTHFYSPPGERRGKNENEITLQIFHFKFSSFQLAVNKLWKIGKLSV